MSFGKSGREDKENTIPTNSHSASPLGAGSARPEAFLGKGCKIVGTLAFSGPVEIEGVVEGEIIAQDRLVIGEGAIVKGKITGGEVVIKGEVQGDIHATKRLSLRRPARVTGNLNCPVLSIDEGVMFEGKCQMAASVGAKETRGSVVSIAERVA